MKYGVLDTAKYLEQMFDIIRVVDPLRSRVIDFPHSKPLITHKCHEFWKKKEICTNCISTRAYEENQTVVKIEYNGEKLYWVMASPINEKGARYVIETLRDITHSSIVENVEKKTVKELREEIAYMNALVVTDELTGCFNRRYIKERLLIDVTKKIEQGQSLIIAMLDIDHFKQVNDTYGHLIGDEILKRIAKIIKKGLPKNIDWVARYGGEEFLIVIYEEPLDEAKKVIEKIRKEVAEELFIYEEHSITITVSAGIAKTTSEINEKDKLIEQADSNLYKAKINGRNQVVC